jgi:hypothetical protein
MVRRDDEAGVADLIPRAAICRLAFWNRLTCDERPG